MKRLSLFLAALSALLLWSCGATQGQQADENAIKLGTAKVSVHMKIGGNAEGEASLKADSVLDVMEIYATTLPIFAYNSQYCEFTPLEREGDTFVAEVPVERMREIGGIRIYLNGGFTGGTMLLFDQKNPIELEWSLTEDGWPIEMPVLKNSALSMDDWQNISSIFTQGICMDVPRLIEQDAEVYKLPWQEVRAYETDTVWPRYVSRTIGDFTVPKAASDWVMNNLKVVFAADCILPYQKYAEAVAGMEVGNPPMESYSFLDSIDYAPDVFLLNNELISQRALLRGILDIPCAEFKEIGETPVAQWQQTVSRALEPAMKERPKLLLDLLSGLSYVRQMEAMRPLTDTQVKNINEGYTDDLGKILLAENDRLVTALKDSSSVTLNDLVAEKFNLQEYLDKNYPGRPVVVALSHPWDDPNINKYFTGKEMNGKFADKGLAILNICDERGETRMWKNLAARFGGANIRIDDATYDTIGRDFGLDTGSPLSYLFFDRAHKLVVALPSFPGAECYGEFLEGITK